MSVRTLTRRQWLLRLLPAAGDAFARVVEAAPAWSTEERGPEPAGARDLAGVDLVEARCIVFAGPECGACADQCPPGVGGLVLVRGRPRIDPQECTGCGRCIDACPTLPTALEPIKANQDRHTVEAEQRRLLGPSHG